MRRERVEELFYIRAICALGIFFIHLSGTFAMSSLYGSKAMHLGILINQFFRFGTPVFMMISGFVLFYNYRSFEEFDTIKFYNKKLKFILLPYLLWSFLYYAIFPYILWTPFNRLFYDYRTISIDFLEFVKSAALGNAYPHLYFIFLIFQFYLLYPLFIKFLIRPMEKRPFLFFTLCTVMQAFILIYEFYLKAQSEFLLVRLFNTYYWKSIFGWFYYFFTGGLFALHYKKVSGFIDKNKLKIIPLYLISVFLYIYEAYYSVLKNQGRSFYERYGSIRPLTMLYATCTIAVLIWLGKKIYSGNSKIKEILKDWGTYSLGIYFLHPFILELIKVKLINKYPAYLGYSRVSTLILLAVSGWTLTVLIVLLLSKFKLRNIIIGRVPAYKGIELQE